ncbi:50S ribosomal protein L11 methyltransferase [Saccharopolyspora griseoalba]|uniref:50S ribosomal protein L11 methyltransferase n=1 Tax=Saccharopolyspora griseoalba TaxID=1431848 RepID=A0ABW2LPX2_9PSEU
MRTIDDWTALGAELRTSPGVHRPSAFSALLATAATDCRDQVVLDAGCGAGLVTIAALRSGAERVIAQDHDPAALADTRRNVLGILGAEAADRLDLREADWSEPGQPRADLLAVNPPQRPSALLGDVPAAELHLHDSGGSDGLDGLRTVLAHANADRVRSTAAAILGAGRLRAAGCSVPQRVAAVELDFSPAWRSLLPALRASAEVWEFHRC